MPRALGQVDARKHQAILDAAADVLAERGFGASIEEVARRAGVSKQTIYNHYGSKTELVRTLVERRRSHLTATFETAPPHEPVQGTLARYALALLEAVTAPATLQLTRMAITSAADMPELGRAVYEAGAKAASEALAAYLAHCPGLDIPNPKQAADIFAGMTCGRLQTRMLMGVDVLDPRQAEARACEAAERFVRAYSREIGADPRAPEASPDS